jgi:hypothetical protein
MVNLMLEVGDVACPVDDMRTTDCLTLFSFLFREGTNREKGEQGLRRRECELVAYVEKVRHADGE